MFGFGRSAQEKAVINLFALQLESLGIPSAEAVGNATKLVDEVLSDIRPRGIDPFKATQGNELAKTEQFVAPRLAAGLTIEDIRAHWNRPLLVVLSEVKMREMVNFIVVRVADLQGKDLVAAGQHYKKTFPRYGDPSRWNPSDKFNVGLREVDVDVYPEFAARIDAWRNRTPNAEVDRLIEQHGTLNAVVRHLVSTGAL